MIDTLAIFNELSETLDPAAARKIAELMGKMYRDLSNVVTKEEFKELTDVVRGLGETVKDISNTVKELAEAQKKTEQRLERLEAAVQRLTEAQEKTEQRVSKLEVTMQELAEAQKRTEQRLERLEATVQRLTEAQEKTEQRLNELAEAQKQTEQKLNKLAEIQKKTEQRVDKLEIAMKELAEAQRQTEQKLNELAEAQKQTEQKLNELAEAQKETERAIARLTRGLEITREQLGGLSRSVGYALENEAYRNLPSILKSRYNIEVIDRLIRTYISDVEINVFGKGRQNGKEVYLVGEAVLKLDDRSKLRLVWDKVNVVREEFGGEVIPIIVTHFAKPDVLERAQKAGIIVIQSFEWV